MAVVLKDVSKISGVFGQEGEERVASLLASELPDNFLLLNSPRIAYRGNIVDIDHIVLTPFGIFIIESKNMNGKITGGLMGNWVQERVVGGRLEFVKIGNPASQVNQYAKIVRQFLKDAYLAQHGEPKNFKVEPIVVFAHDQSNINHMTYTHPGHIGKVRVCKAKNLVEVISSFHKNYFTDEELNWCADALIPPDQRDQTGIYSSLINQALRESFQGRFQILEEIGSGNFGTVYRGYDTKLDRAVAIKRLHHRNRNPEMIQRFNREARASAKLRHEHIVEFYDYYEENDEFYIVMELINGKSLQDKIDAADDLDEMCDIFIDVCEALQHAHDNGVIHRDLKAANIMITDSGRVKITDFGVARIVGEELQTMTHASVGTPSIMAPEQVMGREADHRADIYALGVLIYQLTTGQLPFKGNSIGEVVNNILRNDPVPPSKINPFLPKKFDALIIKALAKEPEDRQQSALDLASQMCSALDPSNQDEGNKSSLTKFINKGWRLLRDDHRKFQVVALITIIVFAGLFSAQAYQDAKTLQSPGILNFSPLNSRNKLIQNPDLPAVINNLTRYVGAQVTIDGKLSEVVGKVNDSIMIELLVPQSNGQPAKVLSILSPNVCVDMDMLVAGEQLKITGMMDKIKGLDNKGDVQPLVVAQSIQLVNPRPVASSKVMNLPVNKAIKQQDVAVTLEKVEFSDTQTRLRVNVANLGSKEATVSLANPIGLQNKNHLPFAANENDQLAFTLPPGQSMTRIIYFGPSNLLVGAADFTLGNNLPNQAPWEFHVEWQIKNKLQIK